MIDDEKLIPSLTEWRKWNRDTFSIAEWTTSEGNISLAIGYSLLFWPAFVEYNGCVIIENHFDEGNFENWKKADYVKNYGQIESVLNHIHILDLIWNRRKKDEINYNQIKFLRYKICEIYKAKLKVEFPDKDFIFHFNGHEILEAFDEYELTFYQKINLNRQIEHGT